MRSSVRIRVRAVFCFLFSVLSYPAERPLRYSYVFFDRLERKWHVLYIQNFGARVDFGLGETQASAPTRVLV